MSASTAAARRAVVVNPFLGNGRAFARASLGLSPVYRGRAFPQSSLRATSRALLIPIRAITTDQQHHSGTPPPAPPPGFNSDEAKKPLPKGASESKKSDKAAATAKNDEKEAARKEADGADAPAGLTELVAKKESSALEGKDGKKDDKKKLTIGQRIKKEVMHYWDGTKLLATEVKISTRLAIKMAAGYELTRRESRQLQRTVQDLGRLVPFSVFVIVPFAEFLLPIALRLFPNLLPSTYEEQTTRDQKAAALRSTRKEVSALLRTTLKETGLPLNPTAAQKEEFANFFRKLRTTGEKPTPEDVIKVCKIFKDDLTLDNLSRPQLVSMCRYMNLNTFGTDIMLRYQIRHRMRQIKRDDRQIAYEGVDSLTVGEVQMASASRGIRTHGVSPARLREDLQAWLDLRLRDGVPSTLLVLSNAYTYDGQGSTAASSSSSAGGSPQIDALMGVLSSIPEELFHEIELEVHNAEGAATNRQRLEVLKEQQELIAEEAEQNEGNESTGYATPRDVENIDDKEEQQAAAAQEAEARQEDAQSQGFEQDQVAEAMAAERDGPDAERTAAETKEKK